MKSAFLSTLLAAAMSVGAASSPALPLTPIPGSSGCNSLAIDGDRLFAANSSKLTVYDISNPLRPRQCGTMPLRGARQITVNGNHLYVSARHWGSPDYRHLRAGFSETGGLARYRGAGDGDGERRESALCDTASLRGTAFRHP
ncbi:MAG: hypothetical protein L6W00_19975 [Lentisphaeria bacterium]|nr:MAG: hypothetical protein L6W00_19975 [Lentisphaeria bacterium]